MINSLKPVRGWRLGAACIFVGAVIVACAGLALGGTTSHHSYLPHVALKSRKAGSAIGPVIANRGTAVDQAKLSVGDEQVIAHAASDGNGQVTGEYLLGSFDGADFYRLANSSGADCYAVGPVSSSEGLFGQVGCLPAFPASTPIVDFTLGQAERVMGIAANNVAAIVLLDSAGNVVARSQVVNNIYSLPAASRSKVVSLVALDANGNQLYSQPEFPSLLRK